MNSTTLTMRVMRRKCEFIWGESLSSLLSN